MPKPTKERNLYKEAFLSQYNLILLGFAMTIALLSGSFLPILAAFGLEILYLAFLPETEFFQNRVAQKYMEIDEEEIDAKHNYRLSKLRWAQRGRYEKLDFLVENTKNNLNKQGDGLGDMIVGQLETLKDRFLWMMETLNSYDRYLQHIDREKLHHDLHQVQTTLATADGVVKKTLQERYNILEKRVERLEKVYENRLVVTTQLATVEDIMRLIFESSLSMTDPRGLSRQVENLLIDVESTEEAIEILDGVGSENETQLEFDAELEKAMQEAEIEAVQYENS